MKKTQPSKFNEPQSGILVSLLTFFLLHLSTRGVYIYLYGQTLFYGLYMHSLIQSLYNTRREVLLYPILQMRLSALTEVTQVSHPVGHWSLTRARLLNTTLKNAKDSVTEKLCGVFISSEISLISRSMLLHISQNNN